MSAEMIFDSSVGLSQFKLLSWLSLSVDAALQKKYGTGFFSRGNIEKLEASSQSEILLLLSKRLSMGVWQPRLASPEISDDLRQFPFEKEVHCKSSASPRDVVDIIVSELNTLRLNPKL